MMYRLTYDMKTRRVMYRPIKRYRRVKHLVVIK